MCSEETAPATPKPHPGRYAHRTPPERAGERVDLWHLALQPCAACGERHRVMFHRLVSPAAAPTGEHTTHVGVCIGSRRIVELIMGAREQAEADPWSSESPPPPGTPADLASGSFVIGEEVATSRGAAAPDALTMRSAIAAAIQELDSPRADPFRAREILAEVVAPERHHDLKVWPIYFDAIASGRKRFEVRHNDRDFREGDRLTLREWRVTLGGGSYSGRQIAARITYVFGGTRPSGDIGDAIQAVPAFALLKGWVVFGFEILAP